MSKDYPAQFGNSPMYRNPEGTLPYPRAHDIPVPYWQQTKTEFEWTGPTAIAPANFNPAGNFWTFTWKGPTFDLRPDLRSAQGEAKAGAVIWSKSARLFFQVFGLNLTDANNGSAAEHLSLTSQDFGHAQINIQSSQIVAGVNVNSVIAINSPSEITEQIVFPGAQTSSAVVVMTPPGTAAGGGDGYPIRYWQPRLVFRKVIYTADYPAGVPQPLSFSAVYY